MSRLHLVFNVIRLTPALDDPIQGWHSLPPPIPEIIDGEEEWIVKEILDSKVINQKLCYLVKWEGYGIEHNSWEPWDSVHAPDLITEFHQKHPGAPWHIWRMEFNTMDFCPILSPVVLGHHSLERGVDVRGHPSNPIPDSNTLYIPLHCRWLHPLPTTVLWFTPSLSLLHSMTSPSLTLCSYFIIFLFSIVPSCI